MIDTGLLLVGAGRMGIAYARVCEALGVQPRVVGRGALSARSFTDATGWQVTTGGLDRWLELSEPLPTHAIVAVDVPELAQTTSDLLHTGVENILVEKPAALSVAELQHLSSEAEKRGAQVRIAYNRRFYAATRRARHLIAEDGGIVSFHFEFTELSDAVTAGGFPPEVLEAWFLANSTHVVDLAFFLGGKPRSLVARTSGSLDWHPAAARFGGVGETEAGTLFTYRADWEAPGRWSVEAMTTRRRLILRPLEELRLQYRGSMDIERLELDDELDRRFKPGLYKQVEAFLTDPKHPDLLTIHEQATLVENFYVPMVSGAIVDRAP